METETIVHPLAPIVPEDARVLILGSLPSPKSREAGMYYANPQNRFWPVLAGLWDEAVPLENDERIAFCSRHHIALWDVIHRCRIRGASDASITDVEPNDIAGLLAGTKICAVFTTGTRAHALYRRYMEKKTGMPAAALPSTSPANARMRLPDLLSAYAPVREAADCIKAR
ncbi:MAG: DNA-deoxyinosine glycosylase [Atopobiaceae bacterium]